MADANSSNEITIAVMGLIGVLITAFLSNWDKLFPKPNEVKATFSGYRATGNFETELRYYFEVSGTRKTIEGMQQQIMQNLRINLISQNPEDSDRISKICDFALDEAITLDEVIKELLPVYQKYFSIKELQELNKFYSTKVMQCMVQKMPALTNEVAPIQIVLMQEYQSRLDQRLWSELHQIESSALRYLE